MEEKSINEENDYRKKKKIFVIWCLIDIILMAVICFLVLEYSYASRCIDYKPIIYLYPKHDTNISVKLSNPENVLCSYPKYNNGWNVFAQKDGTLKELNTGREFYSLYWEGKNKEVNLNMSEGFVVKGKDIANFLEEKLAILGLNERETEEFIIYWLPKMECNKYNFIRFESIKQIESYMKLDIIPRPDTLIRIRMDFKPLREYIKIKEQELVQVKREGYTVVEWGGTEY